ncbi:MAG: exosortase family protein XrtG [Syntrophomonadaceae bacterium]|nr:exosortase family protein XrtG [Syntrophomonadaceae bacterium]
MRTRLLIALCLLLLASLLQPAGAPAAPAVPASIVLDGSFGDWEGKALLANDPAAGVKGRDFKALLWSTNQNERKLYFMVEMYPGSGSSLLSRLYFDINNNGSYEDPVDKFAQMVLQPQPGRTLEVTVELYQVSGALLKTYQGSWGLTNENGGRQFEFAIPMSDLGVYPAQPIRFYLSGLGGGADRLPAEGDNLWSPFPVIVRSRLGTLAFFLAWLVVALMLRRSKIWVFYYIWGAVGFTYIAVLFLRGTFFEYQLEQWTGLILHQVLGHFGIVTYVFDKAPGTLLVLIKVDNSWTTIDIDIESSGMMEMCILSGLIMFYPLHTVPKRVLFTVAGLATVYAANLVRLITVVSVIHWGGRNMYFLSHTLVGRLVFFLLVIAVYWEVFTRPSLKKAKEKVENA